MSRLPRIGLPFALLIAATGVARAADTPTPPVPADALAVVQVHGVGRLKERLVALATAVVPDKADELKKRIDEQIEQLLDGRDLSGLTPDGRAAVFVTGFEADGDTLPIGFLAPVTDYKRFRDTAFKADERRTFEKGPGGIDSIDVRDRPVYLIDRSPQGHVLLTPNKPLAERLAKKYDPLTADVLGETADVFSGSDVSAFVNLTRVNERYADQIKQFRQLLTGLFQPGGVIPGLDARQLEQTKLVYDGLFQAVEDGKGVALGLSVGADGAAVRGAVAFGPDTPSGKILKDEKPDPLAKLADLPAGQAVYTATKFGAGVTDLSRRLAREFSPADDDDRSKANIDRLAGLVATAQQNGAYTAGGLGVGTASLLVLDPTDPGALVDAQLKVYRTLGEGASFQNVRLKGKPTVKEADQRYEGFTLHRATVPLDLEATAASIPDENLRRATVESMKRLVSETPTVWFGTDGKRYVQIGGKDWESARGLLTQFLAGERPVGKGEAFRAVRGRLPAAAAMVAVADAAPATSALGQYIKGMVDALPGLPGLEVPEFRPAGDLPPAFVGLAVVFKPGSAAFTVVVPVEAMKAARKVVHPVD